MKYQDSTEKANTEGHLNVLSIFRTVDGEANAWGPGTWSTFIRLTGCRVGCRWCDSLHTWSIKQGKQMTPLQILKAAMHLGRVPKVTITGGEPLEQWGPEFEILLDMLMNENLEISIETSGTENMMGLIDLYPIVNIIADYKLSYAKAKPNRPLDEFAKLKTDDVIKFVIADATDYTQMLQITNDLDKLGCIARYVASPVHGMLEPRMLFDWLETDDATNIGLNMQMHKYIFGDNYRDEEGGGLDFSKKGTEYQQEDWKDLDLKATLP